MGKRWLIGVGLTLFALAGAHTHHSRHKHRLRSRAPRIFASRGDYVRGDIRAEYRGLIEECATEQGVDPALVAAVIRKESSFNPNSRSRSGAMGLMQLMPSVCARFGVDDPYNAYENIRAGTALLASHLKRYAGNIEKALAAYNAGPRYVDDGTWQLRAQTRRYVPAVEAFYSAYKAYGY